MVKKCIKTIIKSLDSIDWLEYKNAREIAKKDYLLLEITMKDNILTDEVLRALLSIADNYSYGMTLGLNKKNEYTIRYTLKEIDRNRYLKEKYEIGDRESLFSWL